MSILLIQISDIHLKSSNDARSERANAVARAVLAVAPRADACFIVLSGDITNTGALEEYEVANRFVKELQQALLGYGDDKIHVVAVPGNHDLNLRTESDTRQTLLEAPETFLRKPIDFNGSNFNALISVQDNFFSFEASISGQPPVANGSKLHYTREFTAAGKSVLFHCFNTAWLSRRNELQAKLYLPHQLFERRTNEAIDLSVGIFHHPYHWLQADNKRIFQHYIESETDVALSGHEHEQNFERFTNQRGSSLDYLMAPAFGDPTAAFEGFQLLLIDFDQQVQEAIVFAWNEGRFAESNRTQWALHRNTARLVSPFTLRPEFQTELQDMGTGFRHPRCVAPNCELRLRDLYVYPDIARPRLEQVGGNKNPVATFSSQTLPQMLKSHPQLLIFGADDSGKTALSKILFEDLTSEGLHPLLLQGEQLKGITKDASLLKVISPTIRDQYLCETAEEYLQADKQTKTLIVDGFEKSKLSRTAQQNLMRLFLDRFSTIVLFGSDLFQVQDLTGSAGADPFAGFERCTLKEFGRFHREKLVSKWLSLGRESIDEIDTLDKQVAKVDKTISTLLGKNVLPHLPVTILTLLQLLESREPTNTANGSYGYLYEVLLKAALARVNPSDVDEKITYISSVGYQMFKGKQTVLTDEELRRIHEDYCDHYDMVRDFSRTIADLVKAEVLVESKDSYRFKYPYEFYYSIAKYFQDNSTSLRKELYEVADNIYGEANANILIFYVYLNKDEQLIRHVVATAKKIYDYHIPCDMVADVEYINKMIVTKPKPLILECGPIRENRDLNNRRLDAAEEAAHSLALDEDVNRGNDKLREIAKIAVALRTLQVLGQILRNYTGSLHGPLKLEITAECYALGLRALRALLSTACSDIDNMRQHLGSLVAERSGVTDSQELATRTDDVIIWLSTAATFGMIKRISYAVGHVDLTMTYRKVLEIAESLPNQIIDAAIKLDHFDRVPDRELESLEAELRDNHFAYRVVRDLVAEHLYLYSVDFPTMQKLGSRWDIQVSSPRYLQNRAKK